MAKKKAQSSESLEKFPLRLEWRDVSELDENPANWRRHPEPQLTALADVIGEVGWAGALLYNERTSRMIDGHARKKVTPPGTKVPVLVGNWTEEQEKKILATLDPIAGMAEASHESVLALLKGLEADSDGMKLLLAQMADTSKKALEKLEQRVLDDQVPVIIPEKFEVVVECETEEQQKELYEKLTQEGYTCRVLTV